MEFKVTQAKIGSTPWIKSVAGVLSGLGINGVSVGLIFLGLFIFGANQQWVDGVDRWIEPSPSRKIEIAKPALDLVWTPAVTLDGTELSLKAPVFAPSEGTVVGTMLLVYRWDAERKTSDGGVWVGTQYVPGSVLGEVRTVVADIPEFQSGQQVAFRVRVTVAVGGYLYAFESARSPWWLVP